MSWRGVEHDVRGRETGIEGEPQLTRAGDLAPHAAVGEQPQNGDQGRGLGGERVQHAGGPGERVLEGGDRAAHPVGVDEPGDGPGLAQQPGADGVADRRGDTRGGRRAGSGRG